MSEAAQNVVPITPKAKAGLMSIRDMEERPPVKVWYSGFPEWRKKIALAPGMLSVVTGHPGAGKALALDTPIPTPSGWADMGNINVGDFVFDEDGFQCRVIAATAPMLDRECYAVRFDDGSEIIADGDHRWLTESEAARQSGHAWRRRGSRFTLLPKGKDQSHLRKMPSVVTTREIAATLMVSGKRNHAIRLAKAIDCRTPNLPIAPYALGVWLGDGTSSNATVTCADSDKQIMELVIADGVKARRRESKSKGHIGVWALLDKEHSKSASVQSRLRWMGLLNNKHIPPLYMRASIAQRERLLQGLMDTDGHMAVGHQAEFCSVNQRLANDVAELARSLGIRVTIKTGRAKIYGRDCGPKYRVMFYTDRQVFRLQRKLERQGPRPPRRKYHYVVACERVASVPVRCIEVDSPSKLFLAGRSFMPTHNSSLFGNIWFNTVSNHDLRMVVATFENQPVPSYRKKLRQFWAGMAEEKMDPDQRSDADDFIDEHYRFIVHPEERPSLPFIFDMASKTPCDVLSIDPWNRLESQRGKDETETEYIAWCLREMHLFAVQHNCHVQIIAHPAKRDPKYRGRIPFLEDISGSKNWDNMPDQGFVIHREQFWDKETNQRLYDCQLFHLKAREEELGYPCCMNMRLNPLTQRFEMAT